MDGFKAKENEDGFMVLTKEYYEELIEDSNTLSALHAANFPGFEDMIYQATEEQEVD